MRMYSNRTNLTLSIDSDVKRLFQTKYNRQTGYLIEGFMRDMLRIDFPSTSDVNSKDDIEKMIEEASAEKHRAALKLQALELQRKEQSEKAKQEEKERNEVLKVEFEKMDFETAGLQEMVRNLK